ncbi:hypothetical protein BaRGS_00036279, partial [Batillaria attramentaria]
PPDQPVITGYTTGQVLQLGHRLEMICTVHGVSPKVSSIDFTCTGFDDGEDTSNETSVSSSVIIPSISEADDQRLCNCSAWWPPQPSLVLSTSVTLLVVGNAEAQAFPVAAVSGGIAACVLVIVVVVVILVIRHLQNGSRLQTPNRQGNESQNRTAVPHVYENTL